LAKPHSRRAPARMYDDTALPRAVKKASLGMNLSPARRD
jgi:hypothetical protein